MLEKLNRSKTCLFIQWTQPICRYLLVERSARAPRILAAAQFTVDERRPFIEQLTEQLASGGVRRSQVVLLLPRSEFEVASHHLPPARVDELPDLVHGAVGSEHDESAGKLVSDFLVTEQDYTGFETVVFSLREVRIRSLVTAFKAAGMKVRGITFSGLGAVELSRQLADPSASMTVAMGDTDIDLAVTVDGRSVLFRSIPCSSEENEVRAERLGAEIRRTLALAHCGDDGGLRLYLMGDVGTHESLAQRLSDELSLPTSMLNPLECVELATEMESPSRFANLIGMAHAWSGNGLALDFLHPRRTPPKAGPWRRVAFWGGVSAAILLGLGYVAWTKRADELALIAERQASLKRLVGRANKSLELRDVVNAVNDWRGDEIVWLDKIRELSERLPGGEQVVIRRMSMSIDASGNGVIDLAVQVSEPDVITKLEDALRGQGHSVSSKRVTESDETAKLPWAFETHVAFQPTDLPELSPSGTTAEGGGEPDAPPNEPALVTRDAERGGSRQ